MEQARAAEEEVAMIKNVSYLRAVT